MADFAEQFQDQTADEFLAEQGQPTIVPTPFRAFDPALLPQRRFLYGTHYVAGYISVTGAVGGCGKTQRALAEAVAMTSGVPILGVHVEERRRVWHYNLEDPKEELDRRVAAIVQAAQEGGHDISLESLEGYLFVDSGRSTNHRMIVAVQDGNDVIATAHAADLPRHIKEHGIDVVQIDPFIRSHQIGENDNSRIDQVMSIYVDTAETTKSAIELLHHIRKTGSDRVTIEDLRGGSAIVGAARTVRMMNRMSEPEAKTLGIDDTERRYMVRADPTAKANLQPPAEHAEWHRFHTITLPNGERGEPGDRIGVLLPWTPPDAWEGVTIDKINETLDEVAAQADADSPYLMARQSPRWVGTVIIDAFNKSPGPAKAIVDQWLKNGVLEDFTWKRPNRTSVRAVTRGPTNPGTQHG